MPRNTGTFFKVIVFIYSVIWLYDLRYSFLSCFCIILMPVTQHFSLPQPLFHLGCFSNYLKGLGLLKSKGGENMKGKEKNYCNMAEGEVVQG